MGRLGSRAAVTVSAASTMFLLGSGVAEAASAPSVVGQKFSDASSAISGAGDRAVVSTTVGDQKAWPDCLVANQVQRTVPAPPNSSGSATTEILVSLNCYANEASATTPGYSAASPEGKAIAEAAASASASSPAG
jgi:hypothetical protein